MNGQRIRRAGHRCGRWLLPVVASSTLALALSALSAGTSGASPKSDKSTFCQGGYTDVSYAGPVSGSEANYGQEQTDGFKLAIAALNKGGGFKSGPLKGCKVKLLGPYDDRSTPSTGASIASRLVTNSHLLLYFGNVDSGVTVTALPILARAGIPMINSYSTSPKITSLGYKNIFRTILTANGYGAAIATTMVKDFHKKSLAALWPDDIFGQGSSHAFISEANKLGAKVVVNYSYPATNTDFSVMVSEVKNAHPDGVALLGVYTADALELKQLVTAGVKPSASELIMANPSDNTSTFISIAGGATNANGVYLTGIWNPGNANKTGRAFANAFEKKYGSAPAEDAATAYDAFNVFVDAVDHGGGNRSTLTAALHKITAKHPYAGITGKLGFLSNGQCAFYPPILLQVKSGQIQAASTP